jgi:hypothetical protein
MLRARRGHSATLRDLPPVPAPPADDGPQRRSNIVKKRHPDQKGTGRLAERFGDRLVCARYRTDPESGCRFTTVEIVVEERPPVARAPSQQLIRVGWKETELRDAIKEDCGGTWVPDRKLWRAPTVAIKRLRIQNRVVQEST